LTSRYRAFYKEFEVAPNGMWIDLDISPSGVADLKSGLTRSVHIDRAQNIWTAELAMGVCNGPNTCGIPDLLRNSESNACAAL
jgi:hypothetical protein